MNKKLKIGIIGCGTIGIEIAKAIGTRFKNNAELIAISDIDLEKAKALKEILKKRPKILALDDLIKKSNLVIEAASAKVSGQIAKKAVGAKKDIMIMSVGGIINNYTSLFNLAKKKKCRIYLPSGAICGLDGVRAALMGRVDKVKLVTRKPAAALKDAPYIAEKKINLEEIKSETTIFEGSAREAIKGFPANINVACALSIAGIGPDKTTVEIAASPEYGRNIHEVIAEGDFGRLIARTENIASPANPKTSYLAVLSAIATLKQILEERG